MEHRLDFEGLDGILAAALDEAPVLAPTSGWRSTSGLDIEGLDGILPPPLEPARAQRNLHSRPPAPDDLVAAPGALAHEAPGRAAPR
ncbi:MAG: hypothetical protein KC933_10530, partial [Myxococcales bacterium]|nr:hypothetical protein [Myxococcales bacterium]